MASSPRGATLAMPHGNPPASRRIAIRQQAREKHSTIHERTPVPRYRDGVALECRATNQLRDAMGLDDLELMVSYCCTVEDDWRVLEEVDHHGLERGERGLDLYVK
jgi:hypothetical protein